MHNFILFDIDLYIVFFIYYLLFNKIRLDMYNKQYLWNTRYTINRKNNECQKRIKTIQCTTSFEEFICKIYLRTIFVLNLVFSNVITLNRMSKMSMEFNACQMSIIRRGFVRLNYQQIHSNVHKRKNVYELQSSRHRTTFPRSS